MFGVEHSFQQVAPVGLTHVQQDYRLDPGFTHCRRNHPLVRDEVHGVPTDLGLPLDQERSNSGTADQFLASSLKDGVLGEQIDRLGSTTPVDRPVVKRGPRPRRRRALQWDRPA